ncbi:DotU family type IV/VI secretion system protein [Polaromonas sp. JS666]|uniref:DotU family type IV/VI secretion system protein n=1 Tax=Polaromonas sp. (strain JS666 / ATCC BAA-500) TaxID=296591 RepID=UPI000945C3CE|nr:DotU family type IV/VI secretion system protein [Polaromonas sp. JS666]
MRLVDCFIPFMAYVRHFQGQPSASAASVKEQLDSLLADARRKAQEAGIAEADTMSGMFAVAAWADELLLATAWPGAEEWKRLLLQKRYFNVSSAGVEFFTRLEALGPQQLAVREVYFFCLAMGFAGRYGHDRNPKTLEDIKQASLAQLVQGDGLYGDSGKVLFPQAYASAGRKGGRQPGEGRWRWRVSSLTLSVLLAPLAVLAVLYGIYHLIIWQTASSIMAQIK